MTKNSTPSSEFQHEDTCPSCGSPCNIHTDLDGNDECNDCREEVSNPDMTQEEPKQECTCGVCDYCEEQETIQILKEAKENTLKQETLEEESSEYSKQGMGSTLEEIYSFINFINGAKWQAEKMYSEEEVKMLAFNFYYDMSKKMNVPENLISENRTNFDIWFEQFKKKLI